MATCPTCRQAFAAAKFCPKDGARLVDETMDGSVVLDNRYRLIRQVGAGGMGEVYEAEHIHIHRRVAVKILKPHVASDIEAIARLKREAQTTSGLGHPNIVDTYDFGEADGQAYLVMEWLDGVNLDQRMARGPVDVATALEIAAQAAAGLAEAHARGVIHRDVKPANLFLTTDRHGALVVKIVDFGIAKLAATQAALTATGVLIGTPNYMAPEQAMGEPIDARTDVYALGVILYEMVTGMPPFRGDTPLAVLHQHTSKTPQPPTESATDRGISSDVEAIILRCLHKRPDERFASMTELARALDEARGTAKARAALVPAPAQPAAREEARATATASPAVTIVPVHSSPPVASLPAARDREPARDEARAAASPRPPVVVVPAANASHAAQPSDADDEDDAAMLAAAAPRRRAIWIACGIIAVLAAGAIVFAVTRSDEPDGRIAIADAIGPGSDADVAVDGPAIASSADAAIDPAIDAAIDSPIDSTIDAARAPDAVATPAWRHETRTPHFALLATSSGSPFAGMPFDLVVDISHIAKTAAAPRVDLSIEHFRDHSVVHTSSHELAGGSRFEASITAPKPGKHHVRIDLLDGERRIGTARFDIVFEPAR